MFYIGLGDSRLNIERVASRVLNGGHHIPGEDIIRRHHSSIENLLSNLKWIDELIVIDNSREYGEIVLQVKQAVIINKTEPLPTWAQLIEKQFST